MASATLFDMPLTSSLARAIMNTEPRPTEWHVSQDTLDRLLDEQRSGRVFDAPEIVKICGVTLVVMGGTSP